ncbi:carbon-nitrogen hydrolase family protein [Methylomarinum sp. Ch1-1]|uniref:Carbon-nitrogen hydrolase family protein n=1 Tax=Methylomarinum roseum TaxID=3067653 RepID=A0AAU7NRE9_9GAMM|nr:carbon-nitrogen hydrolase family protein [Methylomarinum sp. Ch1-1]MDP4520456.1 carbon-nitrogen hydrolase family protein [Methylomarinum sp. Ch1-1]
MVKIASAQYDVSFLQDWRQYEQKVSAWVGEAVEQQAELLLFPEYASMELASLFPEQVYSSLEQQLKALQSLLPDFLKLYSELALSHNIYIQAGTFPVKIENGGYRNRAYLFTPAGEVEYQEKLMMTRFENEQWLIEPSQDIRIFETRFGKLGINVCYDSEFPHYARQMVERGAALILVPSCTDTKAGYYRVRIGCQARALENQCYVVQSSLVGEAPWSEAVDVNCGAAAVYTPVDRGFPDDGVLVIGEFNKVRWVFAELDLRKMERVRMDGQVFNYQDWPKQFRAD